MIVACSDTHVRPKPDREHMQIFGEIFYTRSLTPTVCFHFLFLTEKTFPSDSSSKQTVLMQLFSWLYSADGLSF